MGAWLDTGNWLSNIEFGVGPPRMGHRYSVEWRGAHGGTCRTGTYAGSMEDALAYAQQWAIDARVRARRGLKEARSQFRAEETERTTVFLQCTREEVALFASGVVHVTYLDEITQRDVDAWHRKFAHRLKEAAAP